jgi:glycosyltransferase involved in cell wall biosynthesis
MANINVQIVQHLSPGGIETMALDLQRYLADQEQAFIVSLEGNKDEAIKRWPVLKPFADQLIFMNKPAGLNPGFILTLAKKLKSLGATSVHTHHIGPLLYGAVAARLAKIKTRIHTEHDAWHLNNKRRRWLQRLAIFLAKPRLVADAQLVAANMRKHLQIDDIKVIRNGIDTQRFTPGNKAAARLQLGLSKDAFIVGSAGRLEEVKGHKYLIEAFKGVPENAQLAIAGDGSLRESLEKTATQLGLESRIHFLGRIDDMPSFYQAIDVFVLPSLQEGMPLSPLEAQACNIPVIVTNTGAASETVCPESGLLVEAANTKALSQAIIQTMGKGESNAPRRFSIEHGDIKRMASEYAALRHQTLIFGH